MATPQKYLISEDFRSSCYRFSAKEILEESNENGVKRKMIACPMIVMERKNSNGRIYGYDETNSAVERYLEEWVAPRGAMGELNHPGTPRVNPERACIAITSLTLDEKNKWWYGKARFLSTPLGRLVETLLIEDEIQLATSSRMLGAIDNVTGRTIGSLSIVTAADIVTDPSASQAIIEVIEESKNYIVGNSPSAMMSYEELELKLAKKGLRTPIDDILEGFLSKIGKDL